MPIGAASSEGALTTRDGTALFWRTWAPPETTAHVLFVHGVGEHGGRYAGLAARLADLGIGCLAFDLRGHGRSSGRRGHVGRWSSYLSDVEEVVEDVVGADRRPLYLFGHSLGALICLSLAIEGFVARAGIAGIVTSGASIRPTGVAKPHLVLIARLLSRIAPYVALDLGIESRSLSHDPDVVAAYDEDPALVRRVTVRWGSEVLKALASILADASVIREPMLILHGGADPMAEASGSRWLHETCGGETELRVYEGALHEPHNDPDFADVASDVARWIRSREPGFDR